MSCQIPAARPALIYAPDYRPHDHFPAHGTMTGVEAHIFPDFNLVDCPRLEVRVEYNVLQDQYLFACFRRRSTWSFSSRAVSSTKKLKRSVGGNDTKHA